MIRRSVLVVPKNYDNIEDHKQVEKVAEKPKKRRRRRDIYDEDKPYTIIDYPYVIMNDTGKMAEILTKERFMELFKKDMANKKKQFKNE